MKFCIVAFSIVLCAPILWAQGRPVPPSVRQADQVEAQSERDIPPPLRRGTKYDLAKVKRDADELASLAQSVPPEVDQTTKGVLPKDLGEKLKRIEKLAKQLRSEIAQ
jgi:hypothetical protein